MHSEKASASQSDDTTGQAEDGEPNDEQDQSEDQDEEGAAKPMTEEEAILNRIDNDQEKQIARELL